MTDGLSASDVAVLTGGTGRNNDGWGGYGNGWGGNGGGANSPGFQG